QRRCPRAADVLEIVRPCVTAASSSALRHWQTASSAGAAAAIDHRRFAFLTALLCELIEALGDLGEDLRGARLRRGLHDRRSLVAPLADALIDRHLPEERRLGKIGDRLTAALPEELVPNARAVDEEAHVLDNAEDRDIHLLAHRDALVD